jgi:transposase, IS30 family
MATYKHFTLSERIDIEHCLKDGFSFKAIGREVNRDCTTIAKEIKNHIMQKKTGAYGKAFNNCLHRFDCGYSYLCGRPTCDHRYCRYCSKCSSVCSDYKEEKCFKLLKPPYVCNSCDKLRTCSLEKSIYSASASQKQYETLRSESRNGITINEAESKRLDNLISPLIQRGQSIHHICSSNTDAIMCSEKTIYNYMDLNLFSARNLDLPRKVRYRPRRKSPSSFKVDKSCRIGRTYEDFIAYMSENSDTPIVEIDTVEGVKGGKVLLTIHFRGQEFMLAFIRDANTSRSVINVFEKLYWELNPDVFCKLFPLILTDNGSEFSNPSAIEFDAQGNRRTRIFYCDPSAPYQKGAAENNHELIRRIVPKGHSFNDYNQEDISRMMNHINSYARKKLNNQSPYQLFSFLHGTDILKKLGTALISPNEVTLKPELLRK